MKRHLMLLLAVLAMLSEPALATPKPKEVPAQPAAAAPVAASAPVKAAEKKAPGAKPVRSVSPATAQYGKAVREMSLNLNQRMTGDPDRDFAAMVLPVQQGAADMAKIEAANGKDPALRKLAEEIVKARASENKQMRDWLAAHPYKPEVPATVPKTGK
jgi:uncharacterized protein (DUF305 family)